MSPDHAKVYELRFERLLNVPRPRIWRCWTQSPLLARWFGPQSWTTEIRKLELRPAGTSHILMRGPNGEESEGIGVFLEVVPERRLAFTNAFTSGWIPSAQPAVVPYMVTFVEMEDEGGGTRYLVRALHWTEEAKKRHEEMGFHTGWEQATDRLEALARAA